jgi:hypothetical protein
LLAYERLSRKPLLFKSFTGLTVQQFDDIYDKGITKRYEKYKLKRLSYKRKEDIKRKTGAGKPFKLNVKNRFLMLLIYYRMYITYTLAGFLFDLDQKSNIAEISKRLNIEYDKSMRTNSAEDISNNQKIKNDRGSRKIFSRLSCFHRLYIEQQIPRPIGNKIKEIFYSGKNALLHDY